jgi:hypothetical protein
MAAGKAGHKTHTGLRLFQTPPTTDNISLGSERIISRAMPQSHQAGEWPGRDLQFPAKVFETVDGKRSYMFWRASWRNGLPPIPTPGEKFRGLKKKGSRSGSALGCQKGSPAAPSGPKTWSRAKGRGGDSGLSGSIPNWCMTRRKERPGSTEGRSGRDSHPRPSVGRQPILGVKEPFPVLFFPVTVEVDAIKIIRTQCHRRPLYHTLPSEKRFRRWPSNSI